MLVREVMSTGPVTVRPSTTVQEAIGLLARSAVTSMPVVDGHGRLRGIVSEADLLLDRVPTDPRLHELAPASDREHHLPDRHVRVEEVMTAHVVVVDPDDDVVLAVEAMTSTAVKSLPVVDRSRRVLGMLSRSDVVRLLAGSDADLRRDIDTALHHLGLGDWYVEVDDGAVDLTGPAGAAASTQELARRTAAVVPGVTSVRMLVG